MVADLPGKFSGPKRDIVMFYRSMPFGRHGSPAFFAPFGEAVARIHRTIGVGRPLWDFYRPFTSCLYVDDGIFVELPNHQLQEETIRLWEEATVSLLGPTALNRAKMQEVGK